MQRPNTSSTNRPRSWRRLLLVGASALTMAVSGLSPAGAADYQLGPQDKVRLKIFEWRASRDAFFEWKAMNDDFTVAADGTLSLPFAGQVQAAGATPSELSKAIGDRLRDEMGLGRAPNVAVEVVEYRPFFIVGHVTKPGEFPFRPGLTVLQAMSIAGGLQRREEGVTRLEREVIAGRGDVGVYALQNVTLLARKARLEAELANADSITFPDQLERRKSQGAVKMVVEQEKSIFLARRDGLATQVSALTGLRDFLEKEVSSLEAQLVFHDRQIELVRKELSGVSSLVNKGFAAAPREIGLERTLAEIQSGRLSAETSLLRARQEISRTDIAILQLKNQQANEVAVSLRETQAQLEELRSKADTAVELLHEAESSAPRLLALRKQSLTAEPKLTIVRQSESGPVEIAATEATAVEPGDTVKVELPLALGIEDFDAGAPLADVTGLPELSSSTTPAADGPTQ
ncbi:MAG: polysaccharide biosynthesis/export family protein [Mesorhizobium sp.]|jgi:protein involved in polysaccharide export with SLBB domain